MPCSVSQALHHAQHPQEAVNEAFRTLNPGGQLIIIDLLERQFKKARDLYVDVWLGFSENKLYQFLKTAGLRQIEVNVVARETEAPNFQAILASGTKGWYYRTENSICFVRTICRLMES